MSRSKRPKGKNRPRRYHHGRNIGRLFRRTQPPPIDAVPIDDWGEPQPLRSNGTNKPKNERTT